ncbi:hypothetical protein FH063_004268 [Azospirillum argentinense]|uniref:Uncharacterized protein n=1 Tax=Azospirillum argentinense TaxID=2970906 RepID=A0A5B0KKW2_9PROT|nr:hypothetical protein FH063_004268 [Azospirillum argentinense]
MRKNLLAFRAGNAFKIFTPQISEKQSLIRRSLLKIHQRYVLRC